MHPSWRKTALVLADCPKAIAIAGGPVGQALGFVVGPALMSPGAVDRGVQEVQQLMCLEVSAGGMSLEWLMFI